LYGTQFLNYSIVVVYKKYALAFEKLSGIIIIPGFNEKA